MSKKTRTLSKFGAAALLIGLVVAGYIVINQMGRDKARAAAAANGQPAVPVTIAIAEARDVPVLIRRLGNVQAYKTVAIRSRVEGQIAINTLVQRLPKLALATEHPEFRQSLTLRGLKTLPVAF